MDERDDQRFDGAEPGTTSPPGSATVTPIAFGTVRATDPFRPQALIARDDGPCVSRETITGQGSVPAIDGSRGCGAVANSPSGTQMVRVDDGTLTVLDLATNRVEWASSLDLDRPRQRVLDVHWTHEDAVVVVGQGLGGVCLVRTECRVIDFADDLVSRDNAPTIVERRPIASKASEVPMPTSRPGTTTCSTPCGS